MRFYDNETLTAEQAAAAVPLRTWTFQTDEYGEINLRYADRYLVSGDAFYTNNAGRFTIPAGSVTIQETKAPDGYTLNSEVKIVHFTVQADGTVRADLHIWDTVNEADDLPLISSETVQKGTACILKTDSETGKAGAKLVGIRFAVINENENSVVNADGTAIGKGNVVQILTIGKNGMAESLELPVGSYRAVELAEDDTVSETGVLTQGVSSKANRYYLADRTYSQYFTVYAGTQTTLDASDERVYTVSTRAHDSETEIGYAYADEDVHFTDTVTVTGPDAGETYRLEAELVYAEDQGTHKAGEVYKDAAGKEVTASETFVAESSETNTADVVFEPFDASNLSEGAVLVCTETLYKDEVLKAAHNDLADEGQRMYFVSVSTSAADEETGSSQACADEEAEIIDLVKLTGLRTGASYTLTGELRDAATGEVIKDADGKEVTAVKEFTADAFSMTLDMNFILNPSEMAGKTTVVTETLYTEGKEIGKHYDLESAPQTVHWPEIRTTLSDRETGTDHAMAGSDVALQDTVHYENLEVGKTYTVRGRLVYKNTGEAVQDKAGNEITGETEFECRAASGDVIVEFTIGDSALTENQPVVAFETLIWEGMELAYHADLSDEDQDMFFPEIKTALTDSETEDHIAEPDAEILLTDEVTYTGLKPETEYKLSGVLMDRDTGKPIFDDSGNRIISETVFITPTAEEGEVKVGGTAYVTFAFSGVSLAGKTAVCFETLYADGKEAAVHADIDAEEQTVCFPDVHTTAVNKDTGTKTLDLSAETVIQDLVKLTNLLPGKSYSVSGKLTDRKTGEPLKDKEGREITAQSEIFTAEAADQEITLEFTLDTSAMSGKSIVVYEDLYLTDPETDEKVLIKKHEDPDDTYQTVKVRYKIGKITVKGPGYSGSLRTSSETKILGIQAHLPVSVRIVFAAMLAAAAAAAFMLVRKLRKRCKAEETVKE